MVTCSICLEPTKEVGEIDCCQHRCAPPRVGVPGRNAVAACRPLVRVRCRARPPKRAPHSRHPPPQNTHTHTCIRMHRFCWPCITQWAERETRCPLCKGRFGSIKRKAIFVQTPGPGTKRRRTARAAADGAAAAAGGEDQPSSPKGQLDGVVLEVIHVTPKDQVRVVTVVCVCGGGGGHAHAVLCCVLCCCVRAVWWPWPGAMWHHRTRPARVSCTVSHTHTRRCMCTRGRMQSMQSSCSSCAARCAARATTRSTCSSATVRGVALAAESCRACWHGVRACALVSPRMSLTCACATLPLPLCRAPSRLRPGLPHVLRQPQVCATRRLVLPHMHSAAPAAAAAGGAAAGGTGAGAAAAAAPAAAAPVCGRRQRRQRSRR
jgi:hypothetical protein